MQYRLPALQNQPGFHNMVPPLNQGNALHQIAPDLPPNIAPRNFAMRPSYLGSGYPRVPGLQHPMVYAGGMMSHRPLSASPGSLSPLVMNSSPATSLGTGRSSGGQVEGCYLYMSWFFKLTIKFLVVVFRQSFYFLWLRSFWCQFIYLSHTSRIWRSRAC